MQDRRFTISVPATSANIGPGFDVCGVSLSLGLTLDVHVGDATAPAGLTLAYTGTGADEVPLDPYKNLLTRIALYVLRCHEIRSFPAHTRVQVHNAIPFGRGLGSSGAAVVAGVLLGDALGELKLSQARMLDFALMVERHPDNVAAALVGGFIGAYLRELPPAAVAAAHVPLAEVLPEYPPDAGEDWGLDPPVPPMGIGHFVRFPWAPEIKAVAIIPRFELSTATAREVLPAQYSRQDLVFNLQRLAVLTTALGQSPPDPELIYEAMKDRIHQPYRIALIPGLSAVTSRLTPATHPGLLGICLSGAGPTILALATAGFAEIARDAAVLFAAEGVEVDWELLEVAPGASVVYHAMVPQTGFDPPDATAAPGPSHTPAAPSQTPEQQMAAYRRDFQVWINETPGITEAIRVGAQNIAVMEGLPEPNPSHLTKMTNNIFKHWLAGQAPPEPMPGNP